MTPLAIPRLTLHDFEVRFADRHLLHGVVRKWAREKPNAPMLINASRGHEMDWAAFERESRTLAMQLLHMGLRRGDFVATSLPLLTEHVLLEYACFQIGAIVAPLDLRLAPAEVMRSMNLLRPKMFVFLGATPVADFRELGRTVKAQCPFITHLVQFSAPEETIEGAESWFTLAAQAYALSGGTSEAATQAQAAYERATAEVNENDGALVIFTTGSTGSPKPALLSHRNIACQCMCISGAFFGADAGTRSLVNLPPSHVGCQTELLMGTLFGGGTAVLLEVFDATRSLNAIQQHKVETVGQIPAMFNFEWRLKDYDSFDLSSLRFAAYGGQQVSKVFVDKLATMAPVVATGLGLTEAAGFCTYVQVESAQADGIFAGLGTAMPVYEMSVRAPMRENGSAGDQVPDGELGEICFHGPQTFLGYVNDPEATARTISKDNFLYTGDIGYKDARGLHLTGRAKLVIKPFGYQVFPADVENHMCLHEKVASCAVVGVEHAMISEAVVAFVEKQPGIELSEQELHRHARALSPYMRPRHYVVLEPGAMPLNRVIKPDYMRLREMARKEIETLRTKGEWDIDI